MSQTAGIVLGIGAVSIANQTVFNDEKMDWRIPVATGLAAVGFSMAEQVWPQGARILAWTALATILLARTDPKVPSPVESAVKWWNEGK